MSETALPDQLFCVSLDHFQIDQIESFPKAVYSPQSE